MLGGKASRWFESIHFCRFLFGRQSSNTYRSALKRVAVSEKKRFECIRNRLPNNLPSAQVCKTISATDDNAMSSKSTFNLQGTSPSNRMRGLGKYFKLACWPRGSHHLRSGTGRGEEVIRMCTIHSKHTSLKRPAPIKYCDPRELRFTGWIDKP